MRSNPPSAIHHPKFIFATIIAILIALLPACGASAAEPELVITQGNDWLRAQSPYLDLKVSKNGPQFNHLGVDSLGQGELQPAGVSPQGVPRTTVSVWDDQSKTLMYRAAGLPDTDPARWTFEFDAQGIVLTSRWTADDSPEALSLSINKDQYHPTLLGGINNSDGSVPLPGLLHMPDHGTFRITATGTNQPLGYSAGTNVRFTLPAATAAQPVVEYRLEVASIYPQLPGIEGDPRFDGFRRNWLNIFQLNPSRRMLSNNTTGDCCGFCFYEYADIAARTPPLAEGLGATVMIRQNLDRVIGDPTRVYGMPGNGGRTGNPSGDSYPSLLIAAREYVRGSGDGAWLSANYAKLKQWTDEKLLATDTNGNGLLEYHPSGSAPCPGNWWDCIAFKHEDAYSNALAYRALGGMGELAGRLGFTADAARYRAAADKLRGAYYDTFYNPATGVLAGWKTADGELHDYYFTFVNGIAIHYGLVDKDQGNAVMDKLLAKMKEVGYERFDLGLPGNLINIPSGVDYGEGSRWGGGNNFQVYENGGATACFAYFTLAALYDLGRFEEADQMLFPMLESFEKGNFQGRGPNGMTKDWKKWNGETWGYEGILVDSYYTLLAVVARQEKIPEPGTLVLLATGLVVLLCYAWRKRK